MWTLTPSFLSGLPAQGRVGLGLRARGCGSRLTCLHCGLPVPPLQPGWEGGALLGVRDRGWDQHVCVWPAWDQLWDVHVAGGPLRRRHRTFGGWGGSRVFTFGCRTAVGQGEAQAWTAPGQGSGRGRADQEGLRGAVYHGGRAQDREGLPPAAWPGPACLPGEGHSVGAVPGVRLSGKGGGPAGLQPRPREDELLRGCGHPGR